MINQQLSDYVGQQLQQGKDREDIRSELLKVGWQAADIDQALSASDSAQSSKPTPLPLRPSYAPTGQQQLNPRVIWLFFLGSMKWVIIVNIVLAYIVFAITSHPNINIRISPFWAFNWLVIVTSALLIFFWIWAKLTYHFYRYELRQDGFRKELGVISKKYVTIPYDRIQNVDIHRSILARILGLSDLRVQTAGSSGAAGAESRLPGLSREVAEQLRDELVRRARQYKSQGL